MKKHVRKKKLVKLYKYASERFHEVVSGDTLSGIAVKYDVLIDQIVELNDFENQNVRLNLGQSIKIPETPEVPNASHVRVTLERGGGSALLDWMRNEEGGNGNTKDMCGNKPGIEEPYLCSYDDGYGNLTIGYGRNQTYQRKQTITRATADNLLVSDINEAADYLRSAIPNQSDRRLQVPMHLSEHQFNALTSIIFNAGIGGYRSSRLHLSYISKGIVSGPEFESAFLSVAVGKSRGLPDRRRRELSMFRDGSYVKKHG